MDKAYILELNFDCDTFSDAKESLNTVLQKLLGTMVGCGAKDGSITMKLDENDRSTTTRLMKVKDMLLKDAIEAKRAENARAMEAFSKSGATAAET